MFNLNSFFPNKEMLHHCFMEKAFSDEEVEQIKFFKKIIPFEQARVGDRDGGAQVEEIRKCESGNFFIDHNTDWIWQKYADLFGMANYDAFMYELSYIECLNYLIYHGSESGKYTEHRDTTLGGFYKKYDRKISSILMLSNPEDYEGGELQIDIAGNLDFQTINLNKGDIVFFDSNFTHRVTPVTKGTREVIVSWVHGKTKA